MAEHARRGGGALAIVGSVSSAAAAVKENLPRAAGRGSSLDGVLDYIEGGRFATPVHGVKLPEFISPGVLGVAGLPVTVDLAAVIRARPFPFMPVETMRVSCRFTPPPREFSAPGLPSGVTEFGPVTLHYTFTSRKSVVGNLAAFHDYVAERCEQLRQPEYPAGLMRRLSARAGVSEEPEAEARGYALAGH
jgi:hypothetical protein